MFGLARSGALLSRVPDAGASAVLQRRALRRLSGDVHRAAARVQRGALRTKERCAQLVAPRVSPADFQRGASQRAVAAVRTPVARARRAAASAALPESPLEPNAELLAPDTHAAEPERQRRFDRRWRRRFGDGTRSEQSGGDDKRRLEQHRTAAVVPCGLERFSAHLHRRAGDRVADGARPRGRRDPIRRLLDAVRDASREASAVLSQCPELLEPS